MTVEAVGLRKSYGKTQVLDQVSLSVPQGSVFALLGPNGAGKTTIVRILATLLATDEGTATVAGFDVVRERAQVRREISLSGQYASVDAQQTGHENLRMMGRLLGLSRSEARQRCDELLERFDLTDAGHRRVATYSGGMRRRLDLAAGLIVRPSVLFLDEPTTGLDPRSRQALWEVVSDCARDGVTVFLTTQYLEEADRLASQIAVMDNGRIVAEGTAATLKQRVAGHRLDLVTATSFTEIRSMLGTRVIHEDPAAQVLGVATDGSAAHVRAVLDEVDPERTALKSFSMHTATLDDVFLALTGTRNPTHSRNPKTASPPKALGKDAVDA